MRTTRRWKAAPRVLRRTAAVAGVGLLATGCGSSSSHSASSSPGGSSTTTAATASFQVTVDNCGRKVTFKAPPAHVVAMDQVATETLLGLGLARSVVGTANEATPVYPGYTSAYNAIPIIGKNGYPSKEVLLSKSPDLVVGNEQFFTYSGFPPGSNFSRAQLASNGIQGFTLVCTGETRSMPLLYQRYLELGRIFGVSKQAQAYVQSIKAGLAATTEKLKGVTPVSTFYYSGGKGTLGTYGGPQEGLVLSGGVNLFHDLPTLVGGMPPTVSLEKVIARNPHAILVENEGGLEPNPPSIASEEAYLRQALKGTYAVSHNQFCSVGFYDFEGGMRTVQAVRQVAACLHPETKF